MQACKIHFELSAFFRFEKFKTNVDGEEVPGSREVAADWFPNLILDQGLNQIATLDSYLNACQVGSGTTAPANGQTALTSRIAGTTTRPSDVTTTSASAPYYVANTRTFRFAEGVATGNIAEVGIGTGVTGTTLFSRALVKDSLGNPTTITILSDESLDVIYQLRYYVPSADITGTVVATGSIGGSYDYILRPANVTTVSISSGWSLPLSQTYTASFSLGYGAKSGDIGLITALPSGTLYDLTSPTSLAYSSGSFYLDRVITASTAQANIPTGLRSMQLKLGVGMYQIQFDPAIPKTATDVVQLTLRLSWGRRP